MSDLTKFRALNRFGLGARPGEAARLSQPRQWLRSQINPQSAILSSSSLVSTQALVEEAAGIMKGGDRQQSRNILRQRMREQAGAEIGAAVAQAMTTDAPFAERLVRFWSNHLAISGTGEVQVAFFAGAYERDAIRPHVFGKFEDMVLASARHPAMLIYLDQMRSIGPNSRAGRNRDRGLNENYARELMELHTLGVDGGYSQQDVQQLALMLTGWTIGGMYAGRNRPPLPFYFQPQVHEPGDKVLMGRTFRESGEDEARQAIRMLVQHPATAQFIAEKLVRHFVSDRPNWDDIDRIAAVFSQTGGDLGQVSLALVDLDSVYAAENMKFRPPQEFVFAVGRALGFDEIPQQYLGFLRSLRHQFWSPPSPQGYSDVLRDWADPDSLNKRAELAQLAAKRVGNRVRNVPALAEQLLQPRNPQALMAALSSQSNTQDALAMLFASPDFQWR